LKIDSDIRVGDFTNALTDRISRCKGFKELRIRIGDCEAVYTREEILRDGFKIKPEDFHIGQSLRSRGVQLSPNTATKLDNFFGTSKKTPKEIAEIRHSARTADEIKGIQQAWNKSRVESLKTALNDGLLPIPEGNQAPAEGGGSTHRTHAEAGGGTQGTLGQARLRQRKDQKGRKQSADAGEIIQRGGLRAA
jgi:anti-sigma28 factor (negative regulator of flagellin synthesis)